MILAILSFCAIFTSIISGVIGMGGGVLLLSLMTFFLPYQVIVPIHGFVQLVSNCSRVFALWRNVKWDFFLYFLVGTPLGYLTAYYILKKIENSEVYFLLLAIFILYTIFKPKKMPEMRLKTYQWTLLGYFASVQGALMGATGPLIAPFFIRSDLDKKQIVSTKAIQQITVHIFKIPLFLSLDFNYMEYANLLGFMSVAAIIGTFIGVRLLNNIDDTIFKFLFKSVLFVAAMRLIYKFVSANFEVLS